MVAPSMKTTWSSALVLGFGTLLSCQMPCAAEERSGEQIYREQCASCHGKSGEGTPDEYPRALVGDRSVAQLARLIAKTMPEDDPGTCVGEDAEKVATFIYEAFYSKTAQARNKHRPGSSSRA